jgi:4'-phosphopantetheinyl transferase
MTPRNEEQRLAVPELQPGQVHAWCIAGLHRQLLDTRFTRLLSVVERERADRFHFEIDRLRFITARAALRILLGRYLNQLPERLCFSVNSHGKPWMQMSTGQPDLRFNLSHSGNVVVLAFALQAEVGIDVETVREMQDMEAVAKLCLSSAQFRAFCQLPRGDASVRAFYRIWTRKEALIKALGTGLSQTLSDFDVTFHDHEPPRLIRADSGFGNVSAWTLYDLSVPETCHAAVAIQGTSFELKSFIWDLNDYNV